VVSIPNGQLAVMSLENFARRDKIWFHHILRLRYETTTEQLRYVLAEIRKMLYQHPKIETSSARIRLVGLGSSSLDLDVFAYVLETSYTTFLEIQEDLLLRMMEIVEASGTGLALPSQTTYVAGDSGLNAAKSESAIAAVREWRDQGMLPFPDFSPETIKEIDNTQEYPPSDSALRNKSKK
jgi:MscS family membrane protein